jgi:hypothetical protein
MHKTIKHKSGIESCKQRKIIVAPAGQAYQHRIAEQQSDSHPGCDLYFSRVPVVMHVQFKAFAGMLFFFTMHPETMRDIFKKSKYRKPSEKKQPMKHDPVPAFKLNDAIRNGNQ